MNSPIRCGLILAVLCAVLVGIPFAHAQVSPDLPNSPSAASGDANTDLLTIFPNHQWRRFWISGQVNVIEQWHGAFPALYNGAKSFSNQAENAASRIYTLYTVTRLTNASDVVLDIEEASGDGLSNSQGVAGFPNIDVVRIPGEGSPLSEAPYLSRVTFRYVFPLGQDREEVEPGIQGVLTTLPVRRLEFRFGKFSLADFLDVNAVGSDSHLQFMNWTVVNNGAWDYAADTRGYTYGVLADLHLRLWSLRFLEALMPQVANGIDLQWNLRKARANNVELELRPQLLVNRSTKLRILAYRNIAAMGNYRDAINAFLAHQTLIPDIVATRRQGRTKNGFGVNAEQELTGSLRAFARFGWNDGHNESFAFTEVDRTGSFGADLAGDKWHRKHDRVGAAVVFNGISRDHREYLALGGLGFILGDGRLTYGQEKLFEGYYTAHLWRGVFAAFDAQHITNPGYNRDRGPVWISGVRLHVDF